MRSATAFGCSFLLGCAVAPPDELVAFVEAERPNTIAVAYAPLGEPDAAFDIDGDALLHAASTMKVPVMVELFRRADAGEIDLGGELRVDNVFHSIVDGSPFALDPAEDSDPELYDRVGTRVPVRELLQRMIARSSNLATNVLIDVVRPESVQRTIESLGADRMQVLRGVEDDLAYRAGRSNTATACDLRAVLLAIAEGRAASESACREMLEVLAAQEFNEMIPAGLPPGTRVAHKTGMITRIRHDAAIVFPEQGRPYVLVVLTSGYDDPTRSAAAIAQVARIVHAARG